ncbi:MAG: 7-carboxy-7-deazaguanine synthase QueE [Candidatus Omnitrophica bacterium]|nr:7-carboxy-7-deazaguanine synthase QueE [Candidatus Omnitrophota bacterium]
MLKGKISEIFDSIQGEGLYLGERQIFVRFFGCNLQCRYCDTQLDSFMEYEAEELVKELKMYRGKYHSVSFTGGEPLLQKDFLKEVLKLTQKNNLKNYLETNGTLPDALREVIDDIHIVAMDLKLPSSTGLNNFWDVHKVFLEIACRKELFLKVVICDCTKEDDLREGLNLIKNTIRSTILILQPDSNASSISIQQKLENFKDICYKENITACIITQIHKELRIK